MEIISKLLLALVLNVLRTMIGYAAPLLDAKDTWNVFEPVIKATCSSDGQCWGWLPISETRDATVVTPDEDGDTSRLQSRRQIASPVPELTLKTWKDGTLDETGREIRPSLPNSKQIPIARITKKGVLVSRSWAGGMPFSVLYMNSHGQRSNHAVTATSAASQRQESDTATKSSTSSVEHSNYQRNRQPTVQPRRQYLSIPQLFISYGWGAFGK